MKKFFITRFLLFSLIILTVFLSIAGYRHPLNVMAEDAAEETNSDVEISAPSAILMEASTGTICYAKNENQPLPMASVTKVMTLTLIFEAIDSGYLDLQDTVTFSEHAASMGGSQAFFEAGEIQTVETLIKCISIASANDAAVAMAEAVSGSEEAFVARMNEKAAALSMTNTHFVNCCGLDDSDHYSSARDLAVISRELILSHPEIFSYCTIWQEDITHTTSRGSFPFTLTNTNKLLKQYPYATGLKTGSTSKAKYCLSATATKDNITMIAVIMGAETAKDRFKDAAALLNYGFANTIVYQEDSSGDIFEVPVQKGVADSVQGTAAFSFSYISTRYIDTGLIQRKENLKENLTAPVQVGDTIGTLDYYLQDQQIGSVPVIAAEAVSRATYPFYLQQTLHQFFGSNKAGK